MPLNFSNNLSQSQMQKQICIVSLEWLRSKKNYDMIDNNTLLSLIEEEKMQLMRIRAQDLCFQLCVSVLNDIDLNKTSLNFK